MKWFVWIELRAAAMTGTFAYILPGDIPEVPGLVFVCICIFHQQPFSLLLASVFPHTPHL